ncbi:hypothetical protein M1328_05615 [Patescibacteria group bacterium]|nr:hypothetical protein [Patescibacteria group bacterium]
MFRLTTRQRFSLIFTLYECVFIVILYSLFFTVFNYASYSQMRKDLTDDMNEIINNHLLINNDQIIFRKDKTGASLKQFLFNENASAIIVSKNGTEVRTYGIFIYDDSSNSRFKTNFLPTLNKVAKTKTSTEKQIVWGEQTLQSLVIPLLNDSKPVGALILAKSTSNIMDLQKSLVIMLSSLAVLSLFGSYFVGYVLARYSLDPLLDLTKVVEKIDLDRLEADLKIEGNPHDELVLLINKFNE